MAEVYIDKDIVAVRELHREVLQIDRTQISIPELLQQQAHNIHSGHAQGNHAVRFHLGCWCTELIGKSAADIMAAKLTLEQAQQAIASEYGFSSWGAVEALDDPAFDTVFESAVDMVIGGQVTELTSSLAKYPELSQQISRFPHGATLLHYIGANGVESHRQVTPYNAADVTRCLIEAGADVNAEANMYGGGSTTLGLLLSSAHPANAGVVDQVADVLRKAGAE